MSLEEAVKEVRALREADEERLAYARRWKETFDWVIWTIISHNSAKSIALDIMERFIGPQPDENLY